MVYSLWKERPNQKEQAMRDNLRRYRAIRDAFIPCSPGQPSGTVARHVLTLAARISGIVGSTSPQLPHLAAKVPNGTQPASRVKRFPRGCDNAPIREEVYVLPSVDVLLRHLALQTGVLVMDGRGVGRGCPALMIPVVDKGRALPLAWRVRPAPKGHFPEDLPIALVALIREGIPEGAQGVLVGEGACDGTALPATRHAAGWSYACRTALSTVAPWEGETFRLATLGACRKPGTLVACKEGQVTREAYGPVMGRSWWAKGYDEPRYVVSTMPQAEEACRWDEKRFRSETFFSDQQSRGFHMQKSPLSDVQRLSRL